MNHEPTPERSRSKYDSPRDEVLHRMATEGWANESSGSEESVTGHFSKIKNTEHELLEVTQAFSDAIAEVGLQDVNDLIGNFILVEADDGFVLVCKLESAAQVDAAFDRMQSMYTEWCVKVGR